MASLVLEDLRNTMLPSQVRRKLQTLPSDLNKIYDKILSQVDASCVEIAKFVLRLLVVARRPRTVQDLAMIRALGQGEWDENTICEPLVYLDTNSQTINLVHQSAKDYLTSIVSLSP
jgi:hypothetical protein